MNLGNYQKDIGEYILPAPKHQINKGGICHYTHINAQSVTKYLSQ